MRSALSLLLLPLAALAAVPAATQTPVPQPVGAAPHDRLLPLQGGQNFRDLGGYKTADGRTTRWGLLFRSGSMHYLTPADYTYLEGRGIRTVCDFRSTAERQAEPVDWPVAAAPHVLADDYSQATLAGNLAKPAGPPTLADAKATMTATYGQMLVRFNSQYRRMFAELLAGHAPLAFNCSAGKDRTGVAAALLLTALGVPRPTVIEDYLLTNRYLDAGKVVRNGAAVPPAMRQLPPEVLRAYMVADPAYIEAALKVVDGHAGGAEGFFHDEMGLVPADLAKLRAMYTS